MGDETLSRWGVLLSMSEDDRLAAVTDEIFYGRFYAERTGDGWRRLDPLEQTEPTADGTEGLSLRETPGVMGMSHQGVIRDLNDCPDCQP